MKETKTLLLCAHSRSFEKLPLIPSTPKTKSFREVAQIRNRLSQFDIYYRLQIAIKGQALVDFIIEFTYSNTTELVGIKNVAEAVKKGEMEREKNDYKDVKRE